jgi:hypothetical protein
MGSFTSIADGGTAPPKRAESSLWSAATTRTACRSIDLPPEPLKLLADRQPFHRDLNYRRALPQIVDQVAPFIDDTT